VFVNVVGGVRVDEPGTDLAVALAVASAAKRIALTGSHTPAAGSPHASAAGSPHASAAGSPHASAPGSPHPSDPHSPRPLACFGELGLTGELRTVGHADRRLAEAERFGLTPVLQPETHKTLRGALAAALAPAKEVVRAA
jgi:DNA repair protein RadA/Sms